MSADPAADARRLEALRHECGPTAPSPPDWTTEIQRRYFPARRGAYNAFVSNPLEVDRLPKSERRILTLLCAADCGERWGHSGLPPDIRSRRRLLGLDLPSLMEDLVPCPALGKGNHPRWRALKLALDKYGAMYIGKKPGPPIQEWIAAKWFELSPAQWLELWTEVKARSYGISTAWGNPFAAAMASVTRAERHAWATRWCDEILRSHERQLRSWVGDAIVASFEQNGEKVPPKVAAMMKLRPAPAPKPPPKAPEPKVARDTYVFFGRESVDLDAAAALDPTTKRQFLAAAAKLAGKSFKTPRSFFVWEAKEEETSIDGVSVGRWKISRASDAKRALYDMWVFLVDNGTVFEVGTTQPAGIAMFQGRFVAEDARGRVVKPGKNPPLETLARELQASLPRGFR